ncbi:helix-turn-helix domain-containing protein [Mesorhizobium sp. B2-1-3A]|uniref:helix-turn-helix domain-containing protein n=1 Tax=Mesorhizobium sp. B2-1-3A TaxID=2589971 RepID=UPI00112AC6AA|nr:helix-turn-helix domain-containing protein [Mesorhizobium sp. B2-1-3A]TPM92710.1 hypothetical protein FJ977_27900 [Mesorhizobium sp. B2-1-3A]
MAEAAQRKLDRGLPRLDMRSPALIARQQSRATLPRLRSAEAKPSQAESDGAAVLAEARREAKAILATAKGEAEQKLDRAAIEAARIVADARHEASTILAAAEAGKPAEPSKVSVRSIILEVAKRHGISPLDITGPSRARPIVEARRAAMVEAYLTRLDLSTPQIGREFGGRDHTTVLHSIRAAGVYRGARKA